ncbi:hypothetical protein [Spongiactinospora sp. 9N601]|uniref:hypothetical protein n=1 Tax=Spongiactinospora sp. 9N601 TaxID=3375149 RepID=UPI0037A95905
MPNARAALILGLATATLIGPATPPAHAGPAQANPAQTGIRLTQPDIPVATTHYPATSIRITQGDGSSRLAGVIGHRLAYTAPTDTKITDLLCGNGRFKQITSDGRTATYTVTDPAVRWTIDRRVELSTWARHGTIATGRVEYQTPSGQVLATTPLQFTVNYGG